MVSIVVAKLSLILGGLKWFELWNFTSTTFSSEVHSRDQLWFLSGEISL